MINSYALFKFSHVMFVFSFITITYSFSLHYRKNCVICGKYPPCLTMFPCKPKGYEGKILSYFMKFKLF